MPTSSSAGPEAGAPRSTPTCTRSRLRGKPPPVSDATPWWPALKRPRVAGFEVSTEAIPPIEKQAWFENVCADADAISQVQRDTAAELDALLPAILDRTFMSALAPPD